MVKINQEEAKLYQLDELGGIILVNDVAGEPTDTIFAEAPIKSLNFIASKEGKFFLKITERELEPLVKCYVKRRLREFFEIKD